MEGWHRRLNGHAKKSKLPLYVLIALLYDEAKTTSLEVRLVREAKLQRHQRKMYRQLQGRLFKLWDEYGSGNRTPTQLLKACARLYAPGK